MHENGDNQRARLLARTQCQARAHRCSNGLGCVEAGHAAHREHHGDTRMMCVPCGVEYRAHLKGLLHLLERGLRRLSWTLQVSPRCFVPWHTDECDEWHVGCHSPPRPGCSASTHKKCVRHDKEHQRSSTTPEKALWSACWNAWPVGAG